MRQTLPADDQLATEEKSDNAVENGTGLPQGIYSREYTERRSVLSKFLACDSTATLIPIANLKR